MALIELTEFNDFSGGFRMSNQGKTYPIVDGDDVDRTGLVVVRMTSVYAWPTQINTGSEFFEFSFRFDPLSEFNERFDIGLFTQPIQATRFTRTFQVPCAVGLFAEIVFDHEDSGTNVGPSTAEIIGWREPMSDLDELRALGNDAPTESDLSTEPRLISAF